MPIRSTVDKTKVVPIDASAAIVAPASLTGVDNTDCDSIQHLVDVTVGGAGAILSAEHSDDNVTYAATTEIVAGIEGLALDVAGLYRFAYVGNKKYSRPKISGANVTASHSVLKTDLHVTLKAATLPV